MSERVKNAERKLREALIVDEFKKLFSETPKGSDGQNWRRSFESVRTQGLGVKLVKYRGEKFGIILVKNKDSADQENPQLEEVYEVDRKGRLDYIAFKKRRTTLVGLNYDEMVACWQLTDFTHTGRDNISRFNFDGYDIVSFVKAEWEVVKQAQANSSPSLA